MNNLLLILSFFITTTFGSKINGYIYDKNTNETLTGVRIISNNDTTYSDLNGYFELENITDITYIQLKLVSYENKDTIIIKDNCLNICNK
jgi:hypothetical protein